MGTAPWPFVVPLAPMATAVPGWATAPEMSGSSHRYSASSSVIRDWASMTSKLFLMERTTPSLPTITSRG